MQPEFEKPDFMENCSVDEIHERMMSNLPPDIDDTPGGFAYDFTRPTAIEKSELLEFYLTRVLMLAFPQYAWDEYLDLHGKQVHLTRHTAGYASGYLKITGDPGTEIEAGTVFCTPATEYAESIGFRSGEDYMIGEDGTVTVAVTAVESGPESNVPAGAVSLMEEPVESIESVTNPAPLSGGTEEESDDDFYDRIAEEYENSNTFLGNDRDYIRWAKEAGAGNCIVESAPDGPGTVTLVLVDTNGEPASTELCKTVYDYIISPDDRSSRLLPTACASLACVAAETYTVNYSCTGIVYDASTDLEQIKIDFKEAVQMVYEKAKMENILRYNDVRPILSRITGVEDFGEFYMNGSMKNISLEKTAYPKTGTLSFNREVTDGI